MSYRVLVEKDRDCCSNSIVAALLCFSVASQSRSPSFDNIWSYGDCLEVKREYYQNCFWYIANVLPLQWAQLTKTVHTARLGREFVFLCFLGCMICLYVGVCFVLPWSVESFPSYCGAGLTNLNEPPSSFLLPPHYCGLGAGSIPLRAIVNGKQCETRGLFMSLVIHYWIGNVQDSQGVSVSQNANYNF